MILSIFPASQPLNFNLPLTGTANAVSADLRPLLHGFPCWELPVTARSELVDWQDAVGPGSQYSVQYCEDEEGLL